VIWESLEPVPDMLHVKIFFKPMSCQRLPKKKYIRVVIIAWKRFCRQYYKLLLLGDIWFSCDIV